MDGMDWTVDSMEWIVDGMDLTVDSMEWIVDSMDWTVALSCSPESVNCNGS